MIDLRKIVGESNLADVFMKHTCTFHKPEQLIDLYEFDLRGASLGSRFPLAMAGDNGFAERRVAKTL